MVSPTSFLLISLHVLFPLLTVCQFVDPFPVRSCTSGVTIGLSTCPNQSGCCFGGASCCAGGCCPVTSYCVNVGTANEGCCPLSDPDSCGAFPSYSKSACTAGSFNPKPSVVCVSVDNDWYCPPGALCGARYPFCIGGGGDTECASESAAPIPTPTSVSVIGTPVGTLSDKTTMGSRSGSVTGTGLAAVITSSRTGEGVAVGPGKGVLGAVWLGLGLVW